MERITTKPTEQKPYTIYAGSFDIEETGCGTCVNPVGVGYCDPEEDTIYLATAPEGFERQLHNTFVRKNGLFVPKPAPSNQSSETKLNFLKDCPLPPEAEPLHSSDGADVAGFNEMSLYTRRRTTHVFPVSLGENPNLTSEKREHYEAIRSVAVLALAAVLHYKLDEELPDRNTMHRIAISDELLIRDPDIVIHR